MAQRIGDLTNKEKEALRLLVEGHDAKSSANLLGLKVHTVNDRLRNARRKLDVSSSREAARILRDTEGHTPQNPPQNDAHTFSGIADEAATPDTAILNQPSQKAPNRWIWLAGGMLIMSVLIAIAIFAAVSNTGGIAPPATTPASSQAKSQSAGGANPSEAQSYDVAIKFLATLDAGDWMGSWDYTGKFVQSQMTAPRWAEALKSARDPLGDVRARELAAVERANTLPGLPNGDHEVLIFSTRFESGSGLRYERLVLSKDGDSFEIVGYFIQ